MSAKLLNKLRLKIETCIELQNGATEEQLQDMLLDVKYLQNYYGTEANGVSTCSGQSNIPDVINSVCGICGKPALENNLCYEHLVCNVPKPPQQTDL